MSENIMDKLMGKIRSLTLKISTVKLIILLALTATTVLGATYLYYNLNINLVGEKSGISFYRWSDKSRVSTLSLSYNIYPNVTVRVKNSTYGLINSLKENKTIYLWIESISDEEKIRSVIINIVSPRGDVVATYEWIGGPLGQGTAIPITMEGNTIYSIEYLITGSPLVKQGDDISISITIMIPEKQ
jgi:hypothetical protein